jgi:hypothetical protein
MLSTCVQVRNRQAKLTGTMFNSAVVMKSHIGTCLIEDIDLQTFRDGCFSAVDAQPLCST